MLWHKNHDMCHELFLTLLRPFPATINLKLPSASAITQGSRSRYWYLPYLPGAPPSTPRPGTLQYFRISARPLSPLPHSQLLLLSPQACRFLPLVASYHFAGLFLPFPPLQLSSHTPLLLFSLFFPLRANLDERQKQSTRKKSRGGIVSSLGLFRNKSSFCNTRAPETLSLSRPPPQGKRAPTQQPQRNGFSLGQNESTVLSNNTRLTSSVSRLAIRRRPPVSSLWFLSRWPPFLSHIKAPSYALLPHRRSFPPPTRPFPLHIQHIRHILACCCCICICQLQPTPAASNPPPQ